MLAPQLAKNLLAIPASLSHALPMTQIRQKAVVATIRRAIPKYKKNLNDPSSLPNLTKYIANIQGTEKILTLEELWREKLHIYKSYMPVGYKPILLDALFNPSNDVDKTLRIIFDNLESMTSFYVANSFEVLHDQISFNNEIRFTIAMAPEFRSLCMKALFKMRFFETDELLKIIKCLAALQLPEKTLIVQSALQMVRHFINEFDEEELATLRVSLESFEVQDVSKKSILKLLKEPLDTRLTKSEQI